MPPPVTLTHHAILALVEPLSRAGWRLDVAASDRRHGHLAFLPIEHAPTNGLPSLVERLYLDVAPFPGYRLTRTLMLDDGTTATLEVAGTCVGTMLRALPWVGAARQLAACDGYVVARHDRLYVGAELVAPPRVQPVAATARLDAAVLHFEFPHAPGLAAELRVAAPGAVRDQMRDDVLALLGWDWSILRKKDGALRGSVRMRGHDLDGAASRVLHTSASHLARLFAEGPRRFGERLALRRLAVTWRRAIPLAAFATMALDMLFADALRGARASPLALALVIGPLLLLALFFFRSQEPRLELPRWPR